MTTHKIEGSVQSWDAQTVFGLCPILPYQKICQPIFWLCHSLPTSWPTLAKKMNQSWQWSIGKPKSCQLSKQEPIFLSSPKNWQGILWQQSKHTHAASDLTFNSNHVYPLYYSSSRKEMVEVNQVKAAHRDRLKSIRMQLCVNNMQ